jgi:hypothetical protein
MKRLEGAGNRRDVNAVLAEPDDAVEWFDAAPMLLGGRTTVFDLVASPGFGPFFTPDSAGRAARRAFDERVARWRPQESLTPEARAQRLPPDVGSAEMQGVDERRAVIGELRDRHTPRSWKCRRLTLRSCRSPMPRPSSSCRPSRRPCPRRVATTPPRGPTRSASQTAIEPRPGTHFETPPARLDPRASATRHRVEDLLQQPEAPILGRRPPDARQAVARSHIGTSTRGHGPRVRHEQIVPAHIRHQQHAAPTPTRPNGAPAKEQSPKPSAAGPRAQTVRRNGGHFARLLVS